MVVVPFLSEDPALVVRTLELAASHPRVSEVIGLHGDDEETAQAVRARASTFRLVPQSRIGSLRAGKGDAINTGFDQFLASDCDRLHFYDADIKTFDRDWIAGAESGLDLGFDTVRHFYPRAATDGMVTAMLVRPALAMLWPHSVLARIKQPLAGEVAFNRRAAEAIAGDTLVREQSDWGIDTAITAITGRLGLSIYENYVAAGKDHQLYGSLAELKTMFWECLGALQRLRDGPPPAPAAHHVDPEAPPASQLTGLVAFDFGATEKLLQRPLSETQRSLLRANFDPAIAGGFRDKRFDLDTPAWLDIVKVLLIEADIADRDWQTVGFQIWVARVLHYTAMEVVKGYDHAMKYVDDMVRAAMLHPVN